MEESCTRVLPLIDCENYRKKNLVIFNLQRELEQKNKKLQVANLKIQKLEKER